MYHAYIVVTHVFVYTNYLHEASLCRLLQLLKTVLAVLVLLLILLSAFHNWTCTVILDRTMAVGLFFCLDGEL